MTTYSIGYDHARMLRPLAASDEEAAALDRLEEFTGTEMDMRVAAGLLMRHGRDHAAAELLRMLSPTRAAG